MSDDRRTADQQIATLQFELNNSQRDSRDKQHQIDHLAAALDAAILRRKEQLTRNGSIIFAGIIGAVAGQTATKEQLLQIAENAVALASYITIKSEEIDS